MRASAPARPSAFTLPFPPLCRAPSDVPCSSRLAQLTERSRPLRGAIPWTTARRMPLICWCILPAGASVIQTLGAACRLVSPARDDAISGHRHAGMMASTLRGSADSRREGQSPASPSPPSAAPDRRTPWWPAYVLCRAHHSSELRQWSRALLRAIPQRAPGQLAFLLTFGWAAGTLAALFCRNPNRRPMSHIVEHLVKNIPNPRARPGIAGFYPRCASRQVMCFRMFLFRSIGRISSATSGLTARANPRP